MVVWNFSLYSSPVLLSVTAGTLCGAIGEADHFYVPYGVCTSVCANGNFLSLVCGIRHVDGELYEARFLVWGMMVSRAFLRKRYGSECDVKV